MTPKMLKTGKLAPKWHAKTLRFSLFSKSSDVPAPPEKIFLEYKVDPSTIGMFGNDECGDCVLAMLAHWLMLITAHTGKMIVPTLQDALGWYTALTGYDPKQTDANGNNPTDQGCAVTDALNFWQSTGICGHKIAGWMKLDPTNAVQRKQGLWMFLGVGTGVQLPNNAQQQFTNGETWTVTRNSPGLNGHAILQAGEGAEGRDFQTWGKGDQKATHAWGDKYEDEAYVILTPDLIEEANGKSPFGFDYDALTAALKEIAA
jgi:hypothetical protein